jgi:hypothetical protein
MWDLQLHRRALRNRELNLGTGCRHFVRRPVPIFAVTFDCQIGYLRNEWNKEPVFRLAMLGISSEVPIHHNLIRRKP